MKLRIEVVQVVEEVLHFEGIESRRRGLPMNGAMLRQVSRQKVLGLHQRLIARSGVQPGAEVRISGQRGGEPLVVEAITSAGTTSILNNS